MTVTITTVYNNKLVTHELSNVVAIIKEDDIIIFVLNTGATTVLNYNNITFSVLQEVNMLHTVYIYDSNKQLSRQSQIYCNDYCLFAHDNEMILIMLSGNIVYNIRGSYIIVI